MKRSDDASLRETLPASHVAAGRYREGLVPLAPQVPILILAKDPAAAARIGKMGLAAIAADSPHLQETLMDGDYAAAVMAGVGSDVAGVVGRYVGRLCKASVDALAACRTRRQVINLAGGA